MHDSADCFDCEGSAACRRSSLEIQEWMVSYIARELYVSPDQIDVAVPFEQFALDSATAIGMTGDLEAWLGRRIDPTIVYDYPTIQDISNYLAEDGGDGPSA